MRATHLAVIAITAGLALAACTNREKVAPITSPATSTTSLGPQGTAGRTNSPVAGSTSNAASGSSILRQEGPLSGAPVTQ